MQIVLNESLTVAPKVTSDQIDALSLMFIIKYAAITGVESINDLYYAMDQMILPFVPGASRNRQAYQHLEYVGCGSISAVVLNAYMFFTRKYPGLFTKGFNEEYGLQYLSLTREQKSRLFILSRRRRGFLQIDAVDEQEEDELIESLGVDSGSVPRLKQLQRENIMSNEEVRADLVAARPAMAELFHLWDRTSMRVMMLTSVGMAIGHANIKRKTGRDFDLSVWI